MTIIILAILLGILLFASRRACAFDRPDPEQWTPVIVGRNGTGCYIDLKTATFSKESDGHHVIFCDQLVSIGNKNITNRFITKKDFNLSRKTTRDLSYIVYDENGEVIRDTSGTTKESERSLFPENAEVHPISPTGYEIDMYGMLLLDFLGLKGRTADAASVFENLDPDRWVPIFFEYDGEARGYVDVKNAVFPIEPDGPHAFFWYLRREDVLPDEPAKYVLYNVEMNLIYRTDRILDYMILNERGEIKETCAWSPDEYELEPTTDRSEAAWTYKIILARYVAERVIPSEGALVFRKPDPERWHLIYDGEEIDEIAIYIDIVNTVFYKDRDGVHTVFWYQVIPPSRERFRVRTIARFRMNLTKRTYYVSDTIEFDDKGQVGESYPHRPEDMGVETVVPGTAMEAVYDYLLERSKTAKMLKLKSQRPKKATSTKKPKVEKRKTTSEKTKRSRKK